MELRGSFSVHQLKLTRLGNECLSILFCRWQASTNAYGKYLYLGLFASEAAAAQAYDLAALKIRGHTCQTNFPAHSYLDQRGQLPADEHLDNTIAELKSEAARQLLEDLNDEDLADESSACAGPAGKIALIKQRVGLRRLAGLEQQLLLILGADPSASGGSHCQGTAAEHHPHHNQCNQQHYEHQEQQLDGLAPMQVMHGVELPMPSMQELLQVDVGQASATAHPLTAEVCDHYLAGLMHSEVQEAVMDSAPAAARSPAAAARTACDEFSRSSSGALTQRLFLEDDWLHQVGSSPLVPVNALHPKPSCVAEQLPSAVPGVALDHHAAAPAVVQPAMAAASDAGPSYAPAGDGAASPVVARQGSTLLPPVVLDPANTRPAIAGSGGSPAGARGLQPNGVSIADQVANGAQLAVDQTTSCVSISWLQSQLPPHCQLQHVLHHSHGLVGMMYAQPSSAVAAGVLWGSAVWDGACFRYSQLYGSAQEAASLCCSVLQLIAGCNQPQQQA
eukprot:gene5552-5788_t